MPRDLGAFLGPAEQWTELARAEIPVPIDPKLAQLRADAAMSAKQVADKRLTGAQDLAWALINNPAFLFNR